MRRLGVKTKSPRFNRNPDFGSIYFRFARAEVLGGSYLKIGNWYPTTDETVVAAKCDLVGFRHEYLAAMLLRQRNELLRSRQSPSRRSGDTWRYPQLVDTLKAERNRKCHMCL